MDKDNWLNKLKQMLQSNGNNNDNGDSEDKKIPPLQKIILVFLIGVAIMILASFVSVEKEKIDPPQQTESSVEEPVFSTKKDEYTMEDFENMYETKLKEILENVVGVSDVEVMINLDSTQEIVVAKNLNESSQVTREKDQNQATRDINDQSREEQVVLIQDDRGERPVIIKTLKPKVRGVLVVAKGADNLRVKSWITEAVQRVLDVEPHKISILPKKG